MPPGRAQDFCFQAIGLLSLPYASDSGLRPTNLTELMSADSLLMEKIHLLVNEEHWNLDDAQHEFSNVRHGMVAVLQPSPRQSPSAAPVPVGTRQRERTPPPQRGESKGKGRKGAEGEEGKGKGEGKDKLSESWEKS